MARKHFIVRSIRITKDLDDSIKEFAESLTPPITEGEAIRRLIRAGIIAINDLRRAQARQMKATVIEDDDGPLDDI